jgi:ABC-type hemin transport system substrate-binding protein
MIFQTYETVEALETRLTEVSQTLDQPEEAKRAAAVILQAIKPFY